MKLSKETLTLLKNFASFNTGIKVQPGTVLSSTSNDVLKDCIFAMATVKEKFPVKFCIYDLPKLLGVISVYENPEIEFLEDKLILKGYKDNRSTTIYRYAQEGTVYGRDAKTLKLPPTVASFNLSTDDFNWMIKTKDILGAKYIDFTSDGTNLNINVDTGTEENAFAIPGVEGLSGDEFRFKFNALKMVMIPSDYTVQLTAQGNASFALFESEALKLKYYVAGDAKGSHYGTGNGSK